MFIKKELEIKGKKFVEIQKPDGDTVVLEVKDGVTKSKGANKLLVAKAKQEARIAKEKEARETREAKEKESPKAKAKKKV